MNKKNSIVVVVIFAFLVSFLTLGNWGEPISKLEKTTERKTTATGSIEHHDNSLILMDF